MNGSGELVERIFYAADGTISEKTRYEYNSKGNIKRAIDTLRSQTKRVLQVIAWKHRI